MNSDPIQQPTSTPSPPTTLNDATAVDANDGTAATNETRDATYDGAYAIGKHDGSAAEIRRAESVWTGLLTGKGGFYSK